MKRTGKTTRKVNVAVEMLFKHGKIFIPNKHDIATQKCFEDKERETVIIDPDWRLGEAQRYLFDKIVMRLNLEHPGQFEVKKLGEIKLKK